MIITIFDALGIQAYLFQSNKLADNIGASFLVNQAIEKWPVDAAREVCPERANLPDNSGNLLKPGIIEDGPYDIELVYNAGGNAIFMIKERDIAYKFAKAYSKTVFEYAPGLEVACHHYEIKTEPCSIGDELNNAFQEMANFKSQRMPGIPLMGMGALNSA